ncbi:LigT-like protein [Fistulina hepatica ATCC 64428]|nr:LigT-like protein [Fistulina hepatica ATCC 64428]
MPGVTLWLVPSPHVALKLKHIMDAKTKRSSPNLHPSSYPNFEPHITLAALPHDVDIPPSDLLLAVPQSLRSIAARIKSVEIGTHYFRSVYLAIDPSPELTALHGHIHHKLQITPRTPSFPHMSLCYVADEDAAAGERQLFYDTLIASGRVLQTSANDIVLLDKDDVVGISSFECTEVWVVRCDGPVEHWQVLDKLPLN